eukprot:SAG11_NODE_1318_length_5212_cov_3.462351_4_plen_172_part_00
MLDQLVRVGRTAVAAAAARGWVRVARCSRQHTPALAPQRGVGEFASLQCSATVAVAAGARPRQLLPKDVGWLIAWEDRALASKSSLNVSGAGHAAANGLYRRVGRSLNFRKQDAEPVRYGHYGHPPATVFFDEGRWHVSSGSGTLLYSSEDSLGLAWVAADEADAPIPRVE